MQCHAQSRQHHRQCKRPATPGKTVCNHHGGKSLSGPAHGRFVHGRYMQSLPARLRQSYDASLADPHLLHLSQEVALVDARLTELLSRLTTSPSGQHWTQLAQAWHDYQDAMASTNPAATTRALTTLDALFTQQTTDYSAWQEISAQLEQRRKLVDSEQKRLLASQQMIQANEAMGLITQLVDIVSRAVLAIPQKVAQDTPDLQPMVLKYSRLALSQIVTDLQLVMTREPQTPTYALPEQTTSAEG